MRYQTIDQCRECHCDDAAGVILYDGPSLEEATRATREARYPDPIISTMAARPVEGEPENPAKPDPTLPL